MKKLLLLSALCAISFSSYSQEEKDFFRPLQGDITMGFNFVGIAEMALTSTEDPLTGSQLVDLRYFWKDDIAFRLGFGMANLSTTTTTASDTTGNMPLIETENIDDASGFVFGLGVEKHIKTKAKRIDPFAGFGLLFTSLGDNEVEATTKITNRNGDFSETKTLTINPGSSAWAAQVNIGFFWFFAHNIAVGGDIAFGYISGGLGGDTKETRTVTNSVGGTTTTTETTVTTTEKADFNAFQTTNTGSINLLIKF